MKHIIAVTAVMEGGAVHNLTFPSLGMCAQWLHDFSHHVYCDRRKCRHNHHISLPIPRFVTIIIQEIDQDG